MVSDLVGLHAKNLRDIFAPLIPRDRGSALVDFPDSANCGEHAIWLARGLDARGRHRRRFQPELVATGERGQDGEEEKEASQHGKDG